MVRGPAGVRDGAPRLFQGVEKFVPGKGIVRGGQFIPGFCANGSNGIDKSDFEVIHGVCWAVYKPRI